MMYVSIGETYGDVSFNVWISTFPCPIVLHEWLVIVVLIFVQINMFIFTCVLGSSESEWTFEFNSSGHHLEFRPNINH